MPEHRALAYESLFTTRDAYRGRVLGDRLRRLRVKYEQYRPRYVFCYGKDNWADFEQVFDRAAFEDMELGRVRVARMNGSAVVLTHFFSSWFMTDEGVDRIAVSLELR